HRAGRHTCGGALGRPVEPGAHSGGRPGPVPDRDRPAIARQHRPRAGRGGRGARRRMDWRTRAPRVGARRRARMGSGPDRVGVRGRLRADLPGDGSPRRLAGRAPRWRDARARRLDHAGAAVNLDDPRAVQQGDPHRVAEILSAFPAQCRAAQALRSEPPLPRLRPSLIIIAGMGGSASGADLLAASGLPRLDVPILVHRGYGLPLTAGKDALVVAVSYSGDTAEVLSAADTALAYGVPVVTLSGGGRLGELATSRRLPHVRLPGGVLPLAGTVPEMNHNEIEAWRGPAARSRHLVFLREDGEPHEIARRFAMLHDLIVPAAGGVSECWARGTGPAARLLALAYVGMWVSYYAALARGVDPWPVPLL